ncbi:hypothetical protein niasHT_012775 [Heterodera trifolii]|uniref:RING-type domain-containing protein n=1 Tax=Heterodera trifolii TaxID=157864 RepID=A0ABD2LL52_9BILA
MAKRGQIPLESQREAKEKEPKEILIGLIDIYNEWQLDVNKVIKSCKKYGKKGKEENGQKGKEKYGQKERRFLQFVSHSLEMKWDGNAFSAGGQQQEEDDDDANAVGLELFLIIALVCIGIMLKFLYDYYIQRQQLQQQQPGANIVPAAVGATAEVILNNNNNNNDQPINIEAIQQHQQQHQQQQQQILALVAAYRAMPQILFMAIDQQRDDCAICLDPIPLETFVRPLPCNHIFHNDCIEKWYGSNHETCPICRREMATQNGPEQHNNGTANGQK